jgi:tRNA threonylcarbamoyladenosine biosynthesis protein TsaB
MTLLAIETSTAQLGVAVLDEERVLAAFELLADYPHAVELPGAVTRILQAAGRRLAQVEAIIVDIGPGSFTGLRIGLAFVKALAVVRRTPVVGVASLDVLAANLPWSAAPICPILDARQRNVYAAWFRPDTHSGQPVRCTDYFLGPPDEFLARLTEPTVFLGDGCVRYRDQLLAHFPKAKVAATDYWWPRAATLGRIGRERFLRGERDDPGRIVPMYLYPFDCSVRGPGRSTAVLSQPRPTVSPVA